MHDIGQCVYLCEHLFVFLDPSRFVDVSTGLLLIQGQSTHLLCTVHQGPVL